MDLSSRGNFRKNFWGLNFDFGFRNSDFWEMGDRRWEMGDFKSGKRKAEKTKGVSLLGFSDGGNVGDSKFGKRKADGMSPLQG